MNMQGMARNVLVVAAGNSLGEDAAARIQTAVQQAIGLDGELKIYVVTMNVLLNDDKDFAKVMKAARDTAVCHLPEMTP